MVASIKGVVRAYHGGYPQVCCMTVEGLLKINVGVYIRLIEVCGAQGSKRGFLALVQPYVNAI